MSKIELPELKEGEIYAGAIINPDGTGNHVILLPSDKDDGDWQSAMDWAKEQGGDLPNREEQALLFNQSSEQFKPEWYWSNTTHKNAAEWAWYQDFRNGYQNYYNYKINELRARAVRRLPI
jgi:hypothetical protein